jgi:hypothetical protein
MIFALNHWVSTILYFNCMSPFTVFKSALTF